PTLSAQRLPAGRVSASQQHQHRASTLDPRADRPRTPAHVASTPRYGCGFAGLALARATRRGHDVRRFGARDPCPGPRPGGEQSIEGRPITRNEREHLPIPHETPRSERLTQPSRAPWIRGYSWTRWSRAREAGRVVYLRLQNTKCSTSWGTAEWRPF